MNAVEESVLQEQGNVKVTDKRVVIGAKTYALANITSVEMGRRDESGSGALLKLVVGLILMGIGTLLTFTNGVSFFALAMAAIGALLVWQGNKASKERVSTYLVKVGSASGESNILESKDLNVIQPIVNAINDAIVRRS